MQILPKDKRVGYLGHRIDEHGLHKNLEKVKAFIEAREPKE